MKSHFFFISLSAAAVLGRCRAHAAPTVTKNPAAVLLTGDATLTVGESSLCAFRMKPMLGRGSSAGLGLENQPGHAASVVGGALLDVGRSMFFFLLPDSCETRGPRTTFLSAADALRGGLPQETAFLLRGGKWHQRPRKRVEGFVALTCRCHPAALRSRSMA